MRLDPKAIAARIGLSGERLVPNIVDCPLCGSSGKLELRSVHHIQCRSCGFLGDLVRLHARVKQEGVDSTVASLVSKGLLDLEGSEKTYLENANAQQTLQKLIDRKAAVLRDGAPSSYQGVLCTLNCRLMTQITPQLRRHMIPLVKGDVEDLEIPISADADPVFKWWGRHGAVGVPTYDGVDVTGFWILTQRGSMHLPLVVRKTTAAFGCVPSMADPAVFIVDTIEDAVRLTVWSAVHIEKPIGFVVPVGVRDTPEHYSAKRVIYWSASDEPAWILRSRHCPQNLVMLNSSVTRSGVYPFDGDFPKFMHEVEILALPAYAGIAKHLLSLPRRDAIKAVASEPMEPAERSKISAHASGEDARLLLQLFSAQAPLSVDWSGLSVSETPDGWVAKGRVISSVVFYLDELRPLVPGPDALVTGSVVYKGRSVAFQEKLSLIRKNPAMWLENFAVQRFGVIAYIERPWRPRLLELSLKFRSPNPIMPGQRYGWENHTLRMPLFIVDGKDLSPSFEVIEGPLTPIPAAFTEAEKDAFNSEGFCRLFLVLLQNIIQTEKGAGSGWALVNEPHVVERVANALGLTTQHDPSDALIQAQRSDPIMRPTVLNAAVGRAIGQGSPANMLVSLDRMTALLANTFHAWPVLTISQAVEYQCLRGVFFALQAFLAQPRTVRHYRELATVVDGCFGIKGALFAAGLDLDRAHNNAQHGVATKLTDFFVTMHGEGLLPVKITDKGVHIAHADFYALTAETQVPVPNAKELSHALALVKFIVGGSDEEWILSNDAWYFHASSTATR